MSPARGLSAALVLAVSALLPRPIPASDDNVVVHADRLQPSVLRTAMDGRVRFVNRSGADVHVELIRQTGHHVFPVHGELAAAFHRPGQHLYLVHVRGRATALEGVVDVQPASGEPVSRTCSSVTIMEVCIEP